MKSLASFNKLIFGTLLLAFTLGLVACGGDDSDNSSGTPDGEGGQAGAAGD